MITVGALPQNRGFVGALVNALAAAPETSSLPGRGDVVYLKAAGDEPR